MYATRAIVICRSCRAFWDAGGPAACDLTEHAAVHVPREMHVHRDEVTLPDDTVVVAVTFDERDPYDRTVAPDFGLYLDERWQPPWPHAHLDWPDFGLPTDTASFLEGLGELLARARTGQRVEVGCWGAHGRTGTALASLAILTGLPRDEAVGWVRATYCADAVETAAQEAFVSALAVPTD
jgi:hypothetical protein